MDKGRNRVNHVAVKLVLAVAAAFLLWQLQFVFIILLVAFMLTVILLPFVRLLHKARIPAVFAVFLPLLALIGLLTLLGVYVAPAVRDQSVAFAESAPRYLEELPFAQDFDIEAMRAWVTSQLSDLNFGQIAINVGAALFKFLFALITILVITVYWLSDYNQIKRTLISYLPAKHRRRAKDAWYRVENKLGKWFLGQIMISTVVGVMVWIAALLLGLPYAAVLGVLAAVLEIVPTVGPVVAALPAVLLGATESVEKALLVILVYVIIQQVESHFVTPMLMGRRVRLHPIVIIGAFLVGSVTFGLVGALLSVPVAIIASAIVDSFRGEKEGAPELVEKPT
jgi:predicted PurR-regulated permease PerM